MTLKWRGRRDVAMLICENIILYTLPPPPAAGRPRTATDSITLTAHRSPLRLSMCAVCRVRVRARAPALVHPLRHGRLGAGRPRPRACRHHLLFLRRLPADTHPLSLSQLLYIFLCARDGRLRKCILSRPSVMAVSEPTPSPTLQDFSTTWASETFVVVPGAGQMVLACPQQIFAEDGSDDPPLAPVPLCPPAPRKQGGARLRCAPRITPYELPLTDPVPAYGSPYAERCGTREGRKTRRSSRRRRSMGASRCAAPKGEVLRTTAEL